MQQLARALRVLAQIFGSVVEAHPHNPPRFVPHGQLRVGHRHDRAPQVPRAALGSVEPVGAGTRHREGHDDREHANDHVVASSAWWCRLSKITYRTGRTTRVSAAAENRPPMMTTASGRWTSDPM